MWSSQKLKAACAASAASAASTAASLAATPKSSTLMPSCHRTDLQFYDLCLQHCYIALWEISEDVSVLPPFLSCSPSSFLSPSVCSSRKLSSLLTSTVLCHHFKTGTSVILHTRPIRLCAGTVRTVSSLVAANAKASVSSHSYAISLHLHVKGERASDRRD